MRLEQLTFTRFLAAIFIVVFHIGLQVPPFNNPDIAFIVGKANYGVSYFFILSGFIMMIAYNRMVKIKVFDYYKNRFARIYPVFMVSIILFYLFNIVINNYRGWIVAKDPLFSLLGVQAWIPEKAMICNFPAWSLSVEFLFYALFPFLYNKIYKKYSVRSVSIVIIFFWIVSQAVMQTMIHTQYFIDNQPSSYNFVFHFPVMHLSQFLMGNLAGLIFLKYLLEKKGNYDLYLIALFAVLLLLFKYPIGIDYHNGLLAVVFVPMILLMVMNTGYTTKVFNLKPLVFLGEISYGIYILHWPLNLWIQTLIKRYVTANDTYSFYIYLCLLIVLSSLSYLFIERPLNNWIRNVKLFKNEQQLSAVLVEERNVSPQQ